MITTIAYSVSHDPGAVYTRMTPVADQSVRVDGNGIIIPSGYNKIIGCAAFVGANGDRCRLVAPSLRQIGLECVAPVTLVISPTTEHIHTVSQNRVLSLQDSEALEVEENSNPAAAEQHTVVVWLSSTEVAPVKGDIRSIGGHINVAQTAGTWAQAAPVFDEDLPPGKYKIVGMRLIAAGGICARIVVPAVWARPGVLVSQTAGVNRDHQFRFGNMGVLTEFDLTTQFNIELLSSAAAGAADYQFVLDIIKG